MAQYSLARLRPDYLALWDGMIVTNVAGARAAALKILRGKAAYIKAQELIRARTGKLVPWPVIGLTHYRESDCNFDTWLHNGDPMRDRAGKPIQTTHVPARRPPNPNVDWFEGCYDALVNEEHLEQVSPWDVAAVAYSEEKVNGFGYRNPGLKGGPIPSPYLVGGTNKQKRGKFIRDGKYSSAEWDTQLGCLAVLKMLMDMDTDARLPAVAGAPVPAPTPAAPVPSPTPGLPAPAPSPKADDPKMDEVKPVRKSKTVWGGILAWLGGIASAGAGLFDHISNPWALSAFAIVILVISVAFYLIVKGRIDVQKLLVHLSPDDDGAAS